MAASLGPSGLLGSSGQVLQVQSTTVNSPVSYSGTTDPTGSCANLGLNVTLTPKSSNSKFYISVGVGVGSTTNGNTWAIQLFRNNSIITGAVGAGATNHWSVGVLFKSVDHAGNQGQDTNHGVGGGNICLDTNSGTAGTAITFAARGVSEGGNGHINYVESDYSGQGSGPTSSRTSSTITVFEVEK
jgi:hypothetical protein